AVVALCEERRGIQQGIHYASQSHVVVTYELPLAEVLLDFHDRLKSVSRGYASMDYELVGYRRDDLIKLDMLVNGEPLDALSIIVHREKAYNRGRDLAVKLRTSSPASSTRSPSRPPSAPRSTPGPPSRPCARTSPRSATAATSAASASSSRSRRRGRSG